MGALLNATFGNAVELIVSVVALRKGFVRLVQTSLLGSVLSNLLLVLGTSFLLGGLRYEQQQYNRKGAAIFASMLLLACLALAVPSAYVNAFDAEVNQQDVLDISRITAVIIFAIYLLYLYFQLFTHTAMFKEEKSPHSAHRAPVAPDDASDEDDGEDGEGDEDEEEDEEPLISLSSALFLLLVITLLISFCSDNLIDSIAPVTRAWNINESFIGIILLPIVGNAAEHATAVTCALKNKLDLSIGRGRRLVHADRAVRHPIRDAARLGDRAAYDAELQRVRDDRAGHVGAHRQLPGEGRREQLAAWAACSSPATPYWPRRSTSTQFSPTNLSQHYYLHTQDSRRRGLSAGCWGAAGTGSRRDRHCYCYQSTRTVSVDPLLYAAAAVVIRGRTALRLSCAEQSWTARRRREWLRCRRRPSCASRTRTRPDGVPLPLPPQPPPTHHPTPHHPALLGRMRADDQHARRSERRGHMQVGRRPAVPGPSMEHEQGEGRGDSGMRMGGVGRVVGVPGALRSSSMAGVRRMSSKRRRRWTRTRRRRCSGGRHGMATACGRRRRPRRWWWR